MLLALLAASPAAHAVQWSVHGVVPGDGVAASSIRGFAGAVQRGTGGAVTLADGAPAGGAEVVRALAAGTVQVGVFPLAVLEGDDPVLAMERVPYLAGNFVEARKLWSVLEPRVRQTLAAKGMTLLYAVPSPPPAPLARRPVATLAEWRGIRLLVTAPALPGLSRALGAQAVSGAAPGEALGAGRVDVAFVSAPEAAGARAWEYASYYLRAPAWFPMQLVVAAHGTLDGLDDARRGAVLGAARGAGDEAWALSRQATEAGVQKLRDYGVKTVEPAVGVLIQLEAVGRDLLFLWSESAGEAGARLVEDYYAIR